METQIDENLIFFYPSNVLSRWLAVRIEYIGTLRANKIEIPQSFLKNKSRPVESTLFGFNKEITIASFVPIKDKAVILVSTMHHDKEINFEAKKPQIIIDYNKLKR